MLQTLSDFVAPRPRHARSVHLQRDGAAFSFAHENGDDNGDDNGAPRFFFTPSIREALDAFALGLRVPTERAVTLVGPYGAGKSAFAVFLANLLGNPDSPARELLRARDAELAARFEGERRFLIVVIVGARGPIAPALIGALSDALQNQAPAVWQQMETRLADAHQPRAVADAFGQAARLLCQSDWGGVTIIIDELGKFLEFAANHPRQSDVFALQELAEGAARSGDFPILILGMLHCNPEAYAQRLSRAQQSEWSKVAQRFRQITLFPSDIERMDMVGHALQQSDELHLNGRFAPVVAACAPFAPAGLGARFGHLARRVSSASARAAGVAAPVCARRSKPSQPVQFPVRRGARHARRFSARATVRRAENDAFHARPLVRLRAPDPAHRRERCPIAFVDGSRRKRRAHRRARSGTARARARQSHRFAIVATRRTFARFARGFARRLR